MSLKDKLVGNVLDLSLNELTDVPVKELAASPKATHLDLSCNAIQTLPNDFASLIHLVKIDLSLNNLTELPQNFGNLVNLQSLDLDRNELKTVPLSFCKLKQLRWLDLKDNPLDPKLKAIAGDCLDEKQCQQCAKKVVSHMQSLESGMEREKQKKLKELRAKEAQEKARVEKELEEQRRVKKLEKERRKAESKARNEEKLKQSKENAEKNSNFSESASTDDNILEERKGTHWSVWFLPLICIFVATAMYFLATAKELPLQNVSLSDVITFVKKHSFMMFKASIKFLKIHVIPFGLNVKTFLMRNIHSIMIYISNTASRIELFLSVYF